MKPLAIIPAFNEAAAIGDVLADVRATDPNLPVVVIDDGSTDATAAIARNAGAVVLQLPFNLGCGAALQTGYKYALREGFDCVIQLDADGQHDPANIPVLLKVIERGEADVALGSRFLGHSAYRLTVSRRMGMLLFRLLALIFTGVRFTDVTSGFRALSRGVLHFFTADRYPVDYPDADVLIMLNRAGFRVKEVPVNMHPRKRGRSKQHSGLRPFYYVFKMLLSIALAPLRRETPERRET